jgi:hypothetical protein
MNKYRYAINGLDTFKIKLCTDKKVLNLAVVVVAMAQQNQPLNELRLKQPNSSHRESDRQIIREVLDRRHEVSVILG